MKGPLTAQLAVLLLSGLLSACSVGIANRGAPRHYAQSVAPDSATNGCRQNPELCASLLGKEAAAAASAGATLASAQYLIEAEVLMRIKRALAECADESTGPIRVLDKTASTSSSWVSPPNASSHG